MATGLPIVFSTENQQVENQDLPCPWLLYKHEMSSCNLTLYDVASDNFYLKEIAGFKNKYICGSSYGWLVMIDANDSDCFLFHPFTLENIKLPPREPMSGWAILSSSPTATTSDHGSCFIVFLDEKSCISFCRLGDMEWKQVADTVDQCLRCFTACRDKFYFLDYESSLYMLDLRRDDGKIHKLTKITEGGPRRSELLQESRTFKNHMIESCGELFTVVITSTGSLFLKIGAIEVYKMDFARLEWVQVKALGDLSFFICYLGKNSMSRCASKAGVKGNSIYFINSYDRYLYRYDIEERRIDHNLPCPNLGPEWEDVDDNVPFWI